jgi:hypothetical protein
MSTRDRFYFHNCADRITKQQFISQNNSLLYISIENTFIWYYLKCSLEENFSFGLTFPNVFSEIIYTIFIWCLTITRLRKTKKDLPINGRKIITKYPPGIVFIFHNCADWTPLRILPTMYLYCNFAAKPNTARLFIFHFSHDQFS